MGEILNGDKYQTQEGAAEQSAEQPSWDTVRRLQRESEFTRSSETSANCVIECEGKKFTIEVVESGEDVVLGDVHRLWADTFSEEEVESEDIIRCGVRGVTERGYPQPKYRVVTIKNERGELVSTFAGAQLDLLDERGQPTGESTYFVAYAVTNKEARQKGLAKEAYISAIIDATNESQSQGKKLKFAIGECTHTSEKFWNSVGWKRIYSRDEQGEEYTELEYMQPALDFDENTGEVAEGAGEAPEHLMIDSFGQEEPNRSDIQRSYEAFINYSDVDWPAEAFRSASAHETKMRYLNRIRSEFVSSLNSGEDLVYLDVKARASAVRRGITVHGHDAADHGEAGKEDF